MSVPHEFFAFVLTGAGMSADSGVPTFRGGGGLWEGQRVEDVATPEAWTRNPAQVWRFYQQRRASLLQVEPHAGHHALVLLERELERRGCALRLVTQNVDGLHARAGSTALCMHGELEVLRCEQCGTRVRDMQHLDPERFVRCPNCEYERMRPDVVWFGEEPRGMAEIETWLLEAERFAAIGTSGRVWPAAGFLDFARQRGVPTLVQDLEAQPDQDPGDRFLAGRAVDVVPQIVADWLQ
ncbi:MAG: NAD-dependent deacetylase [Planctomycetota bacterium]